MNQEDPVIPWEQHWISQAKAHRGTMDTPYHRNRLSMVAKLLEGTSLTCNVIDYGCGDAVMSLKVLEEGGRVFAIDINSSMINSTKKLLSGQPGHWCTAIGSVETLYTQEDCSGRTALLSDIVKKS